MRFIHYLLVFGLLISLSNCKQGKNLSTKKISEEKYDSFRADWIEIESLEKKGLGKSIIEKCDAILEKALETDNVNQIYKALVYRSKYSNQIEETSTLKILTSFENNIASSTLPLKNILASAAAELYNQYYLQNRWRYADRTEIEKFDIGDIRSWPLEKIKNRAKELYRVSLSEREKLHELPLNDFKDILQLSEDSSQLEPSIAFRPTLYDFLAERALENYFIDHNLKFSSHGTQDHSVNEILFEDIHSFLAYDFTDDSSTLGESGKIYQSLLQLHQKDQDPIVLVNFNLKRLEYYYKTYNIPNKDSLYLNSLLKFSRNSLYEKHRNEIEEKIASLYFQWGSQHHFTNKNETYRWYLKKAHQICRLKNEDDYASKQCQNLKSQIEAKSLNIRTEKIYPSRQAILFQLNYRNIDKVYFKLIKVPQEYPNHFQLHPHNELLKQSLIGKKPIRIWEVEVDNTGDFQEHALELYTNSLEYGNYFILASYESELNDKLIEFSYANFKISDLSYLSKHDHKTGQTKIRTLDRTYGTPLENVNIKVFQSIYSNSTRTNEWIKVDESKSNEEGNYNFVSKAERGNVQFVFTKGKDTLSPISHHYYFTNNRKDNIRTNSYLFSDRAIYRPGQTIHFKGIVVESYAQSKTAKSNFKTEVILYNVNGEKVASTEVKTNLYGSYSGSFVLPDKALGGKFRIQDNFNSHYFHVEEYKRPSFKVVIDSLNQEIKLGSAINITGKVVAYSGALMGNSKIKYRISRTVHYPYWSYYRSFMPPKENLLIASGEITADNQAAFNIQFEANSSIEINDKWNPVYHFEVDIEATSQAGETQPHKKTIRLSKQAIFLETNLDNQVELEDLKNLIIHAKNINGHEINKQVEIKLWSLESPRIPTIKKFWGPSDQTGINEKEYDKLFPQYDYLENSELEQLNKSSLMLKAKVPTNKEINLVNDLPAGIYHLEIDLTDKDGNNSHLEKKFSLFDENAKSTPYPCLSYFEPLVSKAEVGEEAKFLIGTSLDHLELNLDIIVSNRVFKSQKITLNKEQRLIHIPILEEYRGNFAVQFSGVHSNRFIQHFQKVLVPYSNKKLILKVSNHRDYLRPAAKEKWSIEVKDKSGNPVDAEILASLHDQSLDHFIKDSWQFDLYPEKRNSKVWQDNGNFTLGQSRSFSNPILLEDLNPRIFPKLNWFGFYLNNHLPPTVYRTNSFALGQDIKNSTTSLEKSSNDQEQFVESTFKEDRPVEDFPIRKNFKETAFFYPSLESDKNGIGRIQFEVPEALTNWKFRAIAHTKDLKIGQQEFDIESKKELMIQLHSPRFLRENDQITLSATIHNLSDSLLSVNTNILFFDAITDKPIDIIISDKNSKSLSLEANQNESINWSVKIPNDLSAIRYNLFADSQFYKDGEEKIIPVLSDRSLITESLPMTLRGNQSKVFDFENLIQSSQSSSLRNESYSIEFSSNPIWYAIQALPYLSKQSEENSEQLFARFFANSIATHIINAYPKINQVIQQWKIIDSENLRTKLMGNQSLKSTLIEETPWLQIAKSEEEQQRQIALLFDQNTNFYALEQSLKELAKRQLSNGAWPWYSGMHENRYISLQILRGLGHLKKLGLLSDDRYVQNILSNGIAYLDQEIEKEYQKILAKENDLKASPLNSFHIQYLLCRAYFEEIEITNKEAFQYFIQQAESVWIKRNIRDKASIALALYHIYGRNSIVDQILNSLKDHALIDNEIGMYWKENTSYSNTNEIEYQSLIIELFSELNEDPKLIDELKIWLLKQKQTHYWKNSKSTAIACYSLLMQGKNWINENQHVKIMVNKDMINTKSENSIGNNYFKKTWTREEVKNNLGHVKVEKDGEGIAWGAAYWQYYEDIDKVQENSSGELKLNKNYFKVIESRSTEKMIPIDQSEIQIGDKIRVRLRIESDRELEFVHIKDSRNSAMEPLNIISKYKYQDGLGYYENTKDASTNFFIDRMPKGVYIFEYDLRASHVGKFKSGICTIQSHYASEFLANSNGRIIEVLAE